MSLRGARFLACHCEPVRAKQSQDRLGTDSAISIFRNGGCPLECLGKGIFLDILGIVNKIENVKVEYAPKHDIINIEFLEGVKIENSVETDGVIFDYDKDKRIVSIEILGASKRISKKPFETIDFAIVSEKT